VIILIGLSVLELDLSAIRMSDMLSRLVFVGIHLLPIICIYPYIRRRNRSRNRTRLTPKGGIKDIFKQSKRHYSRKKAKATLLPITLKPEDLTKEFQYKIAVTGTFGKRVIYQDIFKAIPQETPKNPKSTAIFHNRLFAT